MSTYVHQLTIQYSFFQTRIRFNYNRLLLQLPTRKNVHNCCFSTTTRKRCAKQQFKDNLIGNKLIQYFLFAFNFKVKKLFVRVKTKVFHPVVRGWNLSLSCFLFFSFSSSSVGSSFSYNSVFLLRYTVDGTSFKHTHLEIWI